MTKCPQKIKYIDGIPHVWGLTSWVPDYSREGVAEKVKESVDIAEDASQSWRRK